MSTIDEEVNAGGIYGGEQPNTNEGTNWNTTTGDTTTNPENTWETTNGTTTETTGTTATTATTGTTGNVGTTGTTTTTNLPVTRSFWSNMKAFWLQEIDLKKIDWKREIKVELTPYQQKIEDEINEFLHQEITWSSFRKFITKPFTSKNKKNA